MGKKNPRVALGNSNGGPKKGCGKGKTACKKQPNKDILLKASQRRNAITRHNRYAVELSKHFIELRQDHLECQDCGRRITDNNFKLMTQEQCGWHNNLLLKYVDITNPNERIKFERRWTRRNHGTNKCTFQDGGPAFTWLSQKTQESRLSAA